MTSKTTKTFLFASLIAAMTLGGSITPAFAAFEGSTWTSATQNFKCKSNLNDIDNAYINPCSDFQWAADKWNDVSSSNWDLTEDTSGIDIGTSAMGSTGPWATATTIGWPFLFTAWINFNDDYTFGSGANPSGAGDFKSIAVHEIGHLLHLNHYTSGTSVMNTSIGANVVKTTLYSPEITAIQGMY